MEKYFIRSCLRELKTPLIVDYSVFDFMDVQKSLDFVMYVKVFNSKFTLHHNLKNIILNYVCYSKCSIVYSEKRQTYIDIGHENFCLVRPKIKSNHLP